MLGETQPNFGVMIENVVNGRAGCFIEEITYAMIVGVGFTLNLAPGNSEAVDDHWRSGHYWLAHHGEGDDMRVAQLTLIAGPGLWLNHKGFQEPSDFRILRVFIGSVDMRRFLPDWPDGRDEESRRRRRILGHTRHPGAMPRIHWRGPGGAAGLQIARGQQVAGVMVNDVFGEVVGIAPSPHEDGSDDGSVEQPAVAHPESKSDEGPEA
jgi:hypothetical protein